MPSTTFYLLYPKDQSLDLFYSASTYYILVKSFKNMVLVVSSKLTLKRVEGLSFNLGATEVSTVQVARNLGVMMTSVINMEAQVTAVYKSAYYQLYNIEAIWKYLRN